MKAILSTLAMTTLAASFSMAASSSSMAASLVPHKLECAGQITNNDQSSIGNLSSIALTATVQSAYGLKDVTATIKSTDYNDKEEVTVARRNSLTKDANYKPTKYKGSARYNLDKLITTTDFADLSPGDECQILLMLPEVTPAKGTSFAAPVVIHCDQSGGSVTIQCSIK